MNRKRSAGQARQDRQVSGKRTGSSSGPDLARIQRRFAITAGLFALSLVVAAMLLADWYYGLPEGAEAKFVGRQSCVQCHQTQHDAWAGSHHDLAMDLAQEDTVLGDFKDAELTHHGVTSRMFRREGKYYVNTEGPDGKLADFEVKYVF